MIPRTPQPVRRQSRPRGRCEAAFWHPLTRQAQRQIVLAARRYELATRQPGRRNGDLGHVALEVLELLGNLVSYRTGRLDPSLDTLMRLLRRSRTAVVRALQALRAHGFLDWLRRYEPIEDAEGRGPRVRQVSNAYRLALPPRAAKLLPKAPPLPDDLVQEREDRAAEFKAQESAMPTDQFVRAVCSTGDDGGGDARLNSSLVRFTRLFLERESAKRSEYQTKRFPESGRAPRQGPEDGKGGGDT